MTGHESQVSLLTRSDGSSSWKRGPYKAVCSVNGPMEVRIRDELLGEATLELSVRPVAGVSGVDERRFEQLLLNVFRPVIMIGLYPRSLIQITVQILENPGLLESGLVATCVNAITLALLDSGVSMNYVPVSIGCHLDQSGHPNFDDTTLTPSSHTKSQLAICYRFPSLELIHVESLGMITQTQLFSVIEKGQTYAQQIYLDLRKTAEEKILRLKQLK